MLRGCSHGLGIQQDLVSIFLQAMKGWMCCKEGVCDAVWRWRMAPWEGGEEVKGMDACAEGLHIPQGPAPRARTCKISLV